MRDKVDDQLRQVFSVLPAISINNVEAARKDFLAVFKKMSVILSEEVTISNRQIAGPDGDANLRVRIYETKVNNGLRPGLLWIHGGGYVLGFPEMDDALCQRFVKEADCVVVSVDYRLAPENPFPAGLEDSYAALRWMYKTSAEIGIDRSRLAVAGASAGGGLTAAVALLARDRGGPKLTFQMPLCPMIDNRNITPSSHEITDTRVWHRETNIKAWSMYLCGKPSPEMSAYSVPACVQDFSGLPPTYTCVGQLDLFRDETINYFSSLSRAGVDVEFHLYPGCFHGFEEFVPQAEVSQRARSEYVAALKRALHREQL